MKISLYITSLLALVPISEQIEILTFKFNKLSGLSSSLGPSNSARIGLFNMNSLADNKKLSTCHRKCQANSECAIVSVSWSNSTCYMFNVYAYIQTFYQDSNVDMFTIRSFQLNNNGLIKYWPIRNDYKDYKGDSHLIPQTPTIAFSNDRYETSNEALSFRSNGSYKMPEGVYVTGDFTVTAWVRVFSVRAFAKVMDLINDDRTENLELSICDEHTGKPFVAYNIFCKSVSSIEIPLGDWHHLAGVLNGYNISLYMDGVLVGSAICPSQYLPTSLSCTSCLVGRSNWADEDDADADYDELKIYNRALKYDEILKDMNNLHF